MKRPSWPTIILGFLNIIAAGLMMSLAAKCFYARVGWNRHLADGLRVRDGLIRAGEMAGIDDETEKLLEGLSEEGRNKALAYKSLIAQRRAAAEEHFGKIKNSPTKLLVPRTPGDELTKEGEQLMKNLGPRDYAKLMHNHYLLRHPELRAEEQQLAEEKASLLARRESYKREIGLLTLEIERLKERLQAEKNVTQAQIVENEERRKELSNLYAELEEAIAVRALAEGRLKDMEEHLARTRRRFAELRKQSDELEKSIRDQEGITPARGE
jgi:chromosome segregation ATPase